MNKQELILKIHEYISKNKTYEALEVLEQLDDGDLLTDIIILKSRMEVTKKNALHDIVEKKELDRERTKINLAILSLAQNWSLSNKEINNESNKYNEIQFFRELIKILEITKVTFQAQKKVRYKLVELLQERIGPLKYENVPDLFSTYYDDMTPKELRLHKVIRGYTENIIREHNYETLTLLQNNPEYIPKVDRLEYLEKHLLIWKSKYKSIFMDESICLIYVGNDENMRFPLGIEDDIKKYIEELVEE